MCHNGLSSSMDYSNRMTGLYGIHHARDLSGVVRKERVIVAYVPVPKDLTKVKTNVDRVLKMEVEQDVEKEKDHGQR